MEITEKSVFISRNLKPDSAFKAMLEDEGWIVEGRSLIQITPLNFDKVPEADWVLFTSQNGVHFFFENAQSRKIQLAGYKWAVIGTSTAKALLAKGIAPDFTGTGAPASTLEALKPLLTGQRVLMPGAQNRAGNLEKGLRHFASVELLNAYHNTPLPAPAASEAQYLVFTSPMNAEAYFGVHALKSGQRVVAIGPTTAAALKKLGVDGFLVSSEPSERALAEIVIKHFV